MSMPLMQQGPAVAPQQPPILPGPNGQPMVPPDVASNVVSILKAPSASKSILKRREAETRARESFASSHRYARHINENPGLASAIRQMFYDARSAKRTLVTQWNVNYEFLRNRPNNLPMAVRASSLVPEIYPIVASKVGWKCDRRITTEVSSTAVPNSGWWTDTSDLADDLSAILDATYVINGEEGEVAKMLWDGELYGTGFLKTTWDCASAGGLGDAVIRRVDPYTIYPDPQARSMADMNYIAEVRTMSLQECDRRWPGSARVLTDTPFMDQAPEAPDQLANRTTFPRALPMKLPTGEGGSYGMVGGGFIDATQAPGVTVIEMWMRDHDAVSDDDAPYGYRIEENWRCVVVAGSYILMDEPATNMWSHGLHPYSRYVMSDIGEFWGFSTVELLIPTQRSINRLLGAMEHNVLLTGNPTMVDDVRSGISRGAATNRPGQRFTVAPGGKVEWLKPPPMNQMQPELVRYMLQRMEAVSGIAAVTRGGSMPGRNAQGVMDAMQEAAFVRIRMELIQLQLTLADASRRKSSLIVDNYTQARNLAIIGPDGAQKMLAVNPRHFLIPTMEGEVPLEYTLLVDAGASQHTGRKANEDQLFSLKNLGVIDGQAVLDGLDFPGRAAIIKRMNDMQAQAMAMGVDPNKK